MGSGRPEETGAPDLFYNEEEASKYLRSTRMHNIQVEMAERCIELLAIPESERPGRLILDIGCGTGISGAVLATHGFSWVGSDISPAMITKARDTDVRTAAHTARTAYEASAAAAAEAGLPAPPVPAGGPLGSGPGLIMNDMGQGLPVRAGMFDGAVSVSAVQWLCYANASHEKPFSRLCYFFQTLYTALTQGARAVLQFYPEADPARGAKQMEMLTSAAKRAGFEVGIVTDFPGSAKARKFYMVCTTGKNPFAAQLEAEAAAAGQAVGGATVGRRERAVAVRKGRVRAGDRLAQAGKKGSREWILQKKAKARRMGHNVTRDSKYTGRKRKESW